MSDPNETIGPQNRQSRPTVIQRGADVVQAAGVIVEAKKAARSTAMNIAVSASHKIGSLLIFAGATWIVRQTWWQAMLAPATTTGTKLIAVTFVGVLAFAGFVTFSQTGTTAALTTLGNFLSKIIPLARGGRADPPS